MNRRRAQTANAISRDIRSEGQKKRNLITISQATWNRVCYDSHYQREDILTVASCLMDTLGYDAQKQLEVLSGEGQLKVWLQSVQDFNVHRNAYFCFFNTRENHWLVFSLLEVGSQIVVMYKDSHGEEIDPKVRKIIAKRYSERTPLFLSNATKIENHVDCCGPMCLNNFEIMLEGLNEQKGAFILKFENTTFTASSDIASVRDNFLTKLLIYVRENILHSIVELAKERKFVSSMNEFIKLCIQYVGIKDISFNYCSVLKEELEKKETDPSYCINEERVNNAKENFLGNDFVKELIERSSSVNDTGSESKEHEFKLQIEKDFPEQTKTFMGLFSWIMKFKDNNDRDKLLQKISEMLGLEFEKIKQFFDIQRLRSENSVKNEEKKDSPQLRNIEELEKDLPPMSDKEEVQESDVKTTEDLFQELCLGSTWSTSSGEHDDGEDRVRALRQSLSRVRDARDRRWRHASLKDIRVWAKGQRSRSLSKEGSTVSARDVEETLAVMCRAHELVTGGQHLRDTQLIAALVCLLGEKGTLCQMATGEGKTAVVSVLAAAEILLHNRQVDIVTTNQVLAYEGFASRSAFYEALGITVSCNAALHQRSQTDDDSKGARPCYSRDIVYGDMATFQFDYLRHSFERQDTRGNRSFGRVIVDEVDSMLIDNAGRIAKLASPFPGMDALRYVHIKIWQEASKAIEDIADSVEKKLKEKAEDIKKQFTKFDEDLQKEYNGYAVREGIVEEQLKAKDEELRKKRDEYEKFCTSEYERYRKEIYTTEIDDIKPRIKKAKPTQIDLIPAHLRDYASRMEDRWIENALYAMFECSENEQYVLRTDEVSKETVVIPVDYSNTGVTLKNTQWSNGLHQFVQLKHNLRVTVESLTSSFISNVGYINLYGNKVWGVTGTLGSGAETQLLSDAYDVSHAKIPTYKTKVFTEFGGIVVENSQWANVVALDAFLHTQLERSVLIICKTIKDVQHLEKNIKALIKMEKRENIKIKTYADEGSCKIVEEVVGPGEIIIATNIAGRGTDLKTSEALEEKGGLHVCVPFMPANQRVEDQAFGRTARQGHGGSAQITLCRSDVLELGLELSEGLDFPSIKRKRDQLEEIRISEVQRVELRDIRFHDAIFNKFSSIYVRLMEEAANNFGIRFVAMDLKEQWAFWLHEKDFKKNCDTRKTVDEEFLEFIEKASKILGSGSNGRYCGGEIAFNPYYSIQQAEYFFNTKSMSKSEKALTHAVRMDSTNSDILHSAYLKLFEIEIEKGHQLFERFRKAMVEVAGIDLLNVPRCKENEGDGLLVSAAQSVINSFSSRKDETYEVRAKEALKKAKVALEKEINYIKVNFLGEKSESQEGGHESNSSKLIAKEPPSNKDFLSILLSNDCPLIKQITSRYTILQTFDQHVSNLLEQIEKSLNDSTSGLAVVTRVPNYLKKENFSKDPNAAPMLEADLSEIGRLGLETIYALREVHDVPKQVIRRAQGQVAAGVAAAASGALFPPVLFVTGPLASTLISEGICDVVLELIAQGHAEFCEKAYIKGKMISYALSLATLGLSVLSQCVSLLDEAIKFCKSLADLLRRCPYLQSLCKKLAIVVEKIGKYFQKLKYFAQVEKLNKIGKTACRMNIFTSVMQSTAKATVKSLVGSIITEKIVTKSLETMLDGLKPKIKESVVETIKSQVQTRDLMHMKAETLRKLTNDILLGSYGEIACEVLKEVAVGLLRHSNSWSAKIGSLLVESIVTGWQIYKYSEAFCEKLKKQVEKSKEDKANSEDVCRELQEYVISAVTEKIYSIIMQMVGKHANTLVVNPVMNQVWNLCDPSEKERKKAEDELNKNFDELLEAFQLLGLDFGATDEEIKKAWKTSALKHHPDSRMRDKSKSKEESSQQFIRMTEARDLLCKYNKMVATYESLSVSKKPAHVGNIQTLSSEDKQHIVIVNKETGEKTEFGKEHENNGKPTMTFLYEPPSQDGDGHYRVPHLSERIIPTGDDNCFYDAYSTLCKSRGINTTPDRARLTAEKLSVANVIHGSLNTLSELLNNPVTRQMYLQAQSSLLVGGATRRLEKGELYPYERKPNTNLKEERKIKRALAGFANHLTERNQKSEKFNIKKAVGNRLKSMGNTIPTFGSVADKEEIMLAALYIKYDDNTESRIFTSSGSALFHDRRKANFDGNKLHKKVATAMEYQNEGYEYHDPCNIVNKNIFDIHNREELNDTFNYTCAAQKAFYVAQGHMQLKMKDNPYLKVKEVIMRECWFKKGLTKRFTSDDIHYIASCDKCEEVLPKVTGLPPRNHK